MTRRRRTRPAAGRPLAAGSALLALVVAAMGPGPAQAQSLVGAGGLGVPVEPLDARAMALGGVQAGLSEHQLLPGDPASAGGVPIPTITGTLQPVSGTVTDADGEREFGGSRFPLLGLSYPVGQRTVASASFGSFLDQEWDVEVGRTLQLGDRQVEAVDRFEAEGGVTQAQLAVARRFFENVFVGLGAGYHTGSMERTFRRSLDPAEVGQEVEDFRESGEWRARGASVTASALWDVHPLVRIGAGITWSDDLRLEPTAGDVEEKSYPLPLRLRTGTTLSLGEDLDLMAGVSWADWSDTGDALEGGADLGTAWSVGGGVEWTGLVLRDRPLPVRLGYRNADLPFGFGGESGSEEGFSGGLGLNLAEVQAVPIARLDLSLERLSRDAGAVSEDLWRTTLSLRLSGG